MALFPSRVRIHDCREMHIAAYRTPMWVRLMRGSQSVFLSSSLRGVMPMRVMPYMTRHSVPVPPVVVAIVTAIGVRIARSQVLTICVRVDRGASAGVFDNGLRQSRRCESCRGNSGGANQCEFHLGLLVG